MDQKKVVAKFKCIANAVSGIDDDDNAKGTTDFYPTIMVSLSISKKGVLICELH